MTNTITTYQWISVERVLFHGATFYNTVFEEEHVFAGWHFLGRPVVEMNDLADIEVELVIGHKICATSTLLSLIQPTDHKLKMLKRIERLEELMEILHQTIVEKKTMTPEHWRTWQRHFKLGAGKFSDSLLCKPGEAVEVRFNRQPPEELNLRCVLSGWCKTNKEEIEVPA